MSSLTCLLHGAVRRSAAPVLVVLGLPGRDREAVSRCLGEYRLLFAPMALAARLARPVLGRILAFLSRPGRGLALAVYQAEPGRPVLPLADFLEKRGLPLWRLGPDPLHPGRAFVLDRTGLPFDTEGDSDLLRLLNGYDFATALRDKAGRLLDFFCALHRRAPAVDTVLIVAPVRDLSRLAGLARWEHPGAVLELVTDQAWRDNPAARDRLLARAARVYAVTSPAGFEALLRGLHVTVFGRPFYAGWGLTDDRTPQANRQRTLERVELFCGVCLVYTRQALAPGDPVEGFLAAVLEALAVRSGHEKAMPGDDGILPGEVWRLLWRFDPVLLPWEGILALLWLPARCGGAWISRRLGAARRAIFWRLARRLGLDRLAGLDLPDGAALAMLCLLVGRFRRVVSLGDMFEVLAGLAAGGDRLSRLSLALTGQPQTAGRNVPGRGRVIPPGRREGVLALAERKFAQKRFTVTRRLCLRLLYSGHARPEVLRLLVDMERLQFAFHSAHCLGRLAAHGWPDWKKGLFFLMAGENALFAGRHLEAMTVFTAGGRYYARIPELSAHQYNVALDRGFGPLPWQKALLAACIALSRQDVRFGVRLRIVAERFDEARDWLGRHRFALSGRRSVSDQMLAELCLYQGDPGRAKALLLPHLPRKKTVSLHTLAIQTCLALGDKTWGDALWRDIQARGIPVKAYWAWILLCSLGRIEEAFRVHLRETGNFVLQPYLKKQFQAAPLAGTAPSVGRLLILSGCYPGDELRFSRLYPALRRLARAGNVAFSCDPRLFTLLRRSFPDLEFIPTRRVSSLALLAEEEFSQFTALPGSDCTRYLDNAGWARVAGADGVTTVSHCLPDLLADGAVLDRLPRLIPEQDRVLYYKNKLGSRDGRKLVGISWRSLQRHYDRNASIYAIEELKELLNMPGITFINCQYDGCTQEEDDFIARNLHGKLLCFPELNQMHDVDDAAALYSCLDLMISAPTYTCELAACLGVPTRIISKSALPAAFARLGTGRHLFYDNLEFVAGPAALTAIAAHLRLLVMDNILK